MNGWGWFFAGAPLWIVVGGYLSYLYAAKVISAAQKVAADLHLAAEKIKAVM